MTSTVENTVELSASLEVLIEQIVVSRMLPKWLRGYRVAMQLGPPALMPLEIAKNRINQIVSDPVFDTCYCLRCGVRPAARPGGHTYALCYFCAEETLVAAIFAPDMDEEEEAAAEAEYQAD